MGTIILISVLSTLGVVAVVISIVVAFIKLNKKVEDKKNELYASMHNEANYTQEKFKDINNDFNIQIEHIYDLINNVEKQLDSRHDKLYNLIKTIEKDLTNEFDSRIIELEKSSKEVAIHS